MASRDQEMRVRIEPCADGDLTLLEKLNAPEMTAHLGGPESADKVVERQRRYEHLPPGEGRAFKIIEGTGEAVGLVVYWDRSWRGEEIFEIGWGVRPAFQGRGVARAAIVQAIARARADGRHRHLHAFPSVDNGPSNAICGKLGFELLGESDFEYPKGRFMRCNDWRLDLAASAPGCGAEGRIEA